jgi:hypothetical protein
VATGRGIDFNRHEITPHNGYSISWAKQSERRKSLSVESTSKEIVLCEESASAINKFTKIESRRYAHKCHTSRRIPFFPIRNLILHSIDKAREKMYLQPLRGFERIKITFRLKFEFLSTDFKRHLTAF